MASNPKTSRTMKPIQPDGLFSLSDRRLAYEPAGFGKLQFPAATSAQQIQGEI
jgi:hypothetical protein